jgi:hypothetical protein
MEGFMKKYFLPLLTVSMTVCGFAEEVSLSQDAPSKAVAENPVQQTLQDTRKKLGKLAHNDTVVMKNFDNLAEVLYAAFQKEKSMTAQEIQEICSGIDFAAQKHRLQTRKNKEKTPYISHPIGVAYNLMGVGEVREASLIIGALLHDTVEDTQTTFEEIEGKFGKQVAGFVREVTDDKSLAKEARKRLQVINASHKSKGAAQIKLADKLFNLNDLYNNPPADWTQTRIDRYYEWAKSVVDRLPEANDKLHKAVVQMIDQYWEEQDSKK